MKRQIAELACLLVGGGLLIAAALLTMAAHPHWHTIADLLIGRIVIDALDRMLKR